MILGADMSFSGSDYTDKNNIYVLGKDSIQGLNTDEAVHTINAKKKRTKLI